MTNRDNTFVATQLQDLFDRNAILQCVQRYARGLDRHDVDLISSCHHADSVEDHGFYVGPGVGMAQAAIEKHGDSPSSQHHITNHVVEIEGDVAHAETYFFAINRLLSGEISIASGRYLDRFERRRGDWRIAVRVVTVETVIDANIAPVMSAIDGSFAPFARDRADLSYQRPLIAKRESTEGNHPAL